MKIEFNSQRREMSEGITIRFLPIILSQISDSEADNLPYLQSNVD